MHRTPRGKIVTKRGLIANKYMESYLYLYMPNFIFNSEVFRNSLKFINDVVYPICVIVIPLIVKTAPMVYPVMKQL